MNSLVLIAAVALTTPLVLCYDEIYDKMDVDKILADDALFSAYNDCMLNRGPCDVEHSADFKKLLPEVIATSCAKCSPIQREHVRKTVKTLGEKKPDDLVAFKKMYDPEAKYEKSFTEFVFGTD